MLSLTSVLRKAILTKELIINYGNNNWRLHSVGWENANGDMKLMVEKKLNINLHEFINMQLTKLYQCIVYSCIIRNLL